jgi:hypothetical protein
MRVEQVLVSGYDQIDLSGASQCQHSSSSGSRQTGVGKGMLKGCALKRQVTEPSGCPGAGAAGNRGTDDAAAVER